MNNPEFYGDSTRWFIATVVDGSPPVGLEGSVRIRIHGIHSGNVNDIPQADLPWAQAVIPSTEPGVSGLGGACRLLPGALVFGMFMDGTNSQTPIVIGSLAKNEYPSSVQAVGRDDPATNFFAYNVRQQRIQAVHPLDLQEIGTTIARQKQSSSTAVKFFIDNGYSVEQAAGVAGVIDAVSSFDYDSEADGGYGLMRWQLGSSRHSNLKAFGRSINPDRTWKNFEVQMLFILQELRTSMTAAQSQLVVATTIKDPIKLGLYGKGSAAVMVRYFLPPRSLRTAATLNRAEDAATIALSIALGEI
jgi:hypothetical protein